MKVIIIDDERKARNLLRILLEEHCSKITQIIEAENLIEGVDKIKKEAPEIVFLDIEMPKHLGLEIGAFFEKNEIDFEIIFTTAYSKYAIDAFQLSAIDYLLKPMRPDQVKPAVERAINQRNKSQINSKLDTLYSNLSFAKFNKIALPVIDGVRFVNCDEIVFLEADGMYTRIVTVAEEFMMSRPLKHFEEMLVGLEQFFRPHRSFIINLKYIKELVKKDGGYLVMDNGKIVSITKEKKEVLLKLIQKTI